MSLSTEELEDFKTRYEHAFNIRLSDEEAVELAGRLEELYKIVLSRSAAPGETPRAPEPPWALSNRGRYEHIAGREKPNENGARSSRLSAGSPA